MSIVKFVKKHSKVAKVSVAVLITVATLAVIFIQKGEKDSILEIDGEAQDVVDTDVPFEVSK